MRSFPLRLVSACCLSLLLTSPQVFADESSSSSSASSVTAESSAISSAPSSSASSAPASALSSAQDTTHPAANDTYVSPSSYAPYVPHGKAVLTIEQKNDAGLTGTWTLLKPDNTKEVSKSAFKSMTVPAGTYTIFVEKLKGTTASLRLFSGKTELRNVKRPQLTFVVGDGDDLRLSMNFPFTRVGLVSVTSDPPGVGFTLTTPNKTTETGVTPMSFEGAAEGNYSIVYDGIEGCPPPKPTAGILLKDSRLSFDIRIDCAAADAMRAQKQETEEEFVTTKIGTNDLVFTDVQTDAWYAPVMYKVVKWGILTGYSDPHGNPLGLIGPGNDVAIAELAKIAHKAGGIDERDHEPYDTLNRSVHNQWFAPFMISAEARGWQLFQNSELKPDRPATRAEVIGTLYQAMDIPVAWQKGDVFADVNRRTPFAAAIETAAHAGIIEGAGSTDVNGQPVFEPNSSVNRAELAKMIAAMVETYKGEDTAASSSASSED